jgi:uncharacterized membrane protein YkvA (DUF1232 family)
MGFSTTSHTEAKSDEARVKAGLWRKLKFAAARVPFAEDALAAYYCALDRQTPIAARATLWGALAYFVLPFDAIPDYLPLIGFADDAAAIATAIRIIASHMQPAHREAARRALQKLERAD